MILYVKGNLLQSPAQVLVNTVNTVGVMGRGIALEFKRLYPEMFREYRELCEQGKLQIGTLWLYKSPNKWVLNFPTKKHWRSPSHVEYVEAGLRKFVSSYTDLGIHSIAFPALGCGNGQLDFETQVQPLMHKHLRNLPIEIFIYPGRKSAFIEHLNPEQMKEWLRSEPTSLPFAEVWDDLVQVLSRKQNFKTIARNNPFKAQQSQDPRGIRICAANQTYLVKYETLMDFWQQLRTHGFSMRQIAPGIDRQTSYLISIFAELDYIQPVKVADRYEKFQNAAVTGLQVLPSAFNREPVEFDQLLLFQLDQSTWLPSNQMPVK
jgi:O-acetyl-ADP-ribose deacetylase (regulator of RNase III)